jgi:hypothetical protein
MRLLQSCQAVNGRTERAAGYESPQSRRLLAILQNFVSFKLYWHDSRFNQYDFRCYSYVA